MKNKIKWITQTGLLVALLIVIQVTTAPLGNTMVTGSAVNFLLIASVMLAGPASGICVALLSPIGAKLLGIGPLWSLIPFIMLGNVTLVILWYLIGNRKFGFKFLPFLTAWIVAAVAKFVVLYLGIVKLAVPILLQLPEKQAKVISATFSLPQLATALIGGAVALAVIPAIRRILEKMN